MISRENITTLQPASVAYSTAEAAFETTIEMAVAAAINNQANCGEYTCTYENYIPDSLIAKLKDQYKYTVDLDTTSVGTQYIISWKGSDNA